MANPELEFFPTDNIPWVPVEGAPPGHYQKILTEDHEKMFVTRMLKVDPGGASTETFVHDFWEEVYILEGSQWDGDQFFKKGMYACRPPGMTHGPYRTEEGVVTFEVRYARGGATGSTGIARCRSTAALLQPISTGSTPTWTRTVWPLSRSGPA